MPYATDRIVSAVSLYVIVSGVKETVLAQTDTYCLRWGIKFLSSRSSNRRFKSFRVAWARWGLYCFTAADCRDFWASRRCLRLPKHQFTDGFFRDDISTHQKSPNRCRNDVSIWWVWQNERFIHRNPQSQNWNSIPSVLTSWLSVVYSIEIC